MAKATTCTRQAKYWDHCEIGGGGRRKKGGRVVQCTLLAGLPGTNPRDLKLTDTNFLAIVIGVGWLLTLTRGR